MTWDGMGWGGMGWDGMGWDGFAGAITLLAYTLFDARHEMSPTLSGMDSTINAGKRSMSAIAYHGTNSGLQLLKNGSAGYW